MNLAIAMFCDLVLVFKLFWKIRVRYFHSGFNFCIETSVCVPFVEKYLE